VTLAKNCGLSVLPVKDILQGTVITRDKRFIKMELLNKHTSQSIRLPERAFDMLGMVHGVYDETVLRDIRDQPEVPEKKRKRPFGKKYSGGPSLSKSGLSGKSPGRPQSIKDT
jgi:hypothetical protein